MVKTDPNLSDNDSLPKKARKQRKSQYYVDNAMRMELLILITEYGLSCYLAARVLCLPYTNAKVIYRVFREEDRVTSNARIRMKNLCYGTTGTFLLKNSAILRDNAERKLVLALQSTQMTDFQRSKIYDQNFDRLIGKPIHDLFELTNRSLCNNCLLTQIEHQNLYITLPSID